MPRFFFHRTNGYVEHDDEGVELDDVRAARAEAVMLTGAFIKEEPDMVWAGQDFRIEVTDEKGTLLFSVVVQAINSPVAVKPLNANDPSLPQT